ncbi:MAG: MBL fold metallo-hydrolase [Gammaproteobacteria bacterium]|nr:MBL fold metallo-hydrolase [Gammaproteobacteria bacterium]
MNSFICETCGTQYAPSAAPPQSCPVCEDERQYVGWEGQRWTTHDALAVRYSLRLGTDAGLPALALEGFAIPQRALLLATEAGNVLWESLSLVTPAAVQWLREQGGVDRIVISHPHFYASMVEWSEALGGVPILLHAADRSWVRRPARCIEHWQGDQLSLGGGVTLVRTGGHFPGSTVLHWSTGPRGRGALFVGDSPQVTQDRRGVSFMYSYPNYLPMRSSDVLAIRARLAPFDYDSVYGFSWGRNIIGAGRAAVEASFDRYLLAARS